MCGRDRIFGDFSYHWRKQPPSLDQCPGSHMLLWTSRGNQYRAPQGGNGPIQALTQAKKKKNVSKNVRKKRFALQKHRFGAVRISFLHFNLITFYHKEKPIWRPKTVKEMCRCKIRWVSGPFPWRSSPCQNRHAHTPARVKSKPPT